MSWYLVTLLVKVNGYEKYVYQLVEAYTAGDALESALFLESHNKLEEGSGEWFDDCFTYEEVSTVEVDSIEKSILEKFL